MRAEYDPGLTIANSQFLAELGKAAPEGSYLMVTSFGGDPKAKGKWAGHPFSDPHEVDRWSGVNTYFSVSSLRPDASGKLRRRKENFARLLVLVADDVSADDEASKKASYLLQTSPNSYQAGVLLDPQDPDCADVGLVTKLLKTLVERSPGKLDSSGNNPVRWMRLPVGQNQKPEYGTPFDHRLIGWEPRVRMLLVEAAAVFGVDLDTLRQPQQGSTRGHARSSSRNGSVTEGGRNEFLSKRAYAMKRDGVSDADIEVALQALNRDRCVPPLPTEEVQAIAKGKAHIQADETALGVSQDFYAYMPAHQYLHAPSGQLWPASSVDGRCAWPIGDNGERIAPSAWLDRNRPVEQLVWAPDKPEAVIRDFLMRDAGWIWHEGARVFNLYLPPPVLAGDASKAGPWVDHVKQIYPDDWEHIIRWFAHRIQFPGDKCNHALVLGGMQGIGKDTLLEPVKAAVGAWNWSEINPMQMVGRFTSWARCLITRVNEARDLGEIDRFKFYDHSKPYIAAPPDVLRVDEKHLRETYVQNVMGLVITTNYATDGLYLPADDRRHYVAWSPCTRDSFPIDYFPQLWAWMEAGGSGHVAAYLRAVDLSGFDSKAPPMKTAAFWRMVAAGEAPESGELRDVIEALGTPEAVSIEHLAEKAEELDLIGLANDLRDRKSRRTAPHRLERVGYVGVRNPDASASDGLFKIRGRRCAVYARRELPLAAQIKAARELSRGCRA